MQADMERIGQEANAELMTAMLDICRSKTLAKAHSSEQLSQTEKTQFYNCINKFFEAPNHIMSAMNQMQGQQMWAQPDTQLFSWGRLSHASSPTRYLIRINYFLNWSEGNLFDQTLALLLGTFLRPLFLSNSPWSRLFLCLKLYAKKRQGERGYIQSHTHSWI